MKILNEEEYCVIFENNIKVELDLYTIDVYINDIIVYREHTSEPGLRHPLYETFKDMVNYIKKDLKCGHSSLNKIIQNHFKNMELLNELKKLVSKYDVNDNSELLKEIKSLKDRLDDIKTTVDNASYDVSKLERKIK